MMEERLLVTLGLFGFKLVGDLRSELSVIVLTYTTSCAIESEELGPTVVYNQASTMLCDPQQHIRSGGHPCLLKGNPEVDLHSRQKTRWLQETNIHWRDRVHIPISILLASHTGQQESTTGTCRPLNA